MAEDPDPPQPNPRRLSAEVSFPEQRLSPFRRFPIIPSMDWGRRRRAEHRRFSGIPPINIHVEDGYLAVRGSSVYRERAPGIITHGYSDVTETAIALVQRRLSDQEWYR